MEAVANAHQHRLADGTWLWHTHDGAEAAHDHHDEAAPALPLLLRRVQHWDWSACLDENYRIEHAAALLREVRAARRVLDDADDALRRHLYETCPIGRPVEVEGVPPFTVRHGGTRVSWDNDGLRRAGMVAVSDTTGYPVELIEPIVRCWNELGTPKWKVRGLREHGLDPDEFSERRPGAPTVEFHE